jgi:hypothetical protein
MRSQLFYSQQFVVVQNQITDFLNAQDQFLSGSTAQSTRAVGDAIQDILSENFQSILGTELCAEYSSQFARRAMADLAFEDVDGFYYVVDVKTHRLSTKFNMPNLTSVERLSRFYEDDKNYFVVLMVAYDIEDLQAVIERVTFVPIEFLGWDCLTIGALGWGQIQIANSNQITINPQFSRKSWMIEFCDTMLEFYPKEIAKIDSRIERFRKIREEWEKRPD